MHCLIYDNRDSLFFVKKTFIIVVNTIKHGFINNDKIVDKYMCTI